MSHGQDPPLVHAEITLTRMIVAGHIRTYDRPKEGAGSEEAPSTKSASASGNAINA